MRLARVYLNQRCLNLMTWVALAATLPLMGQPGYAEVVGPHNVNAGQPVYTAGVKAYRHGDYTEALRCFRQVLAVDQGNVNAHYYLALSLDNMGQGLEAVTDYLYVVSHGREAAVVDYAKSRLSVIQPNPLAQSGKKTADIALIAASGPMAPMLYRGVASQVAVPLKSNKNALIVDAVINQAGHQADGVFIIDTGATYTSISQDMADKLGLDLTHCDTVYITTANGRIEVPKVTLQKLNVNGLEAYNIEATVIPLRKESSFSGLLGLSFIRQFVLTIDPQANQLIFRKN
jgi:clan AA aspartic protease (TIGR02281 family)